MEVWASYRCLPWESWVLFAFSFEMVSEQLHSRFGLPHSCLETGTTFSQDCVFGVGERDVRPLRGMNSET